MNFRYRCSIALALLITSVSAQTDPVEKTDSRIVQIALSPDQLPPVTVKGAIYDDEKNYFPFYVVSYTTDISSDAQPQLVIKKTKPVTSEQDAFIKKKYGDFLGKEFVLEKSPGISRGINRNMHKLYPFRMNNKGQVEELIDYNIQWKTAQSSFSSARRSSSNFAASSVLNKGTWYKIAVTQSGIHRLSRNFLTAIGINTSQLDPKNIRVYGNGGKMLPELNKAPRIDDLIENALLVVDGGDGTFDNTDYVLFYASGPTEWKRASSQSTLKFEAVKNLYSDTSYYFVTVDNGPGKRISVQPSIAGSNVSTSSYDYYNYHEDDVFCPAKSGRQLLGESFDFVNSYNFRWDEGAFITGEPIITEASVVANFREVTVFRVHGNGSDMSIMTNPVYGGEHPDYGVRSVNSTTALNNSSAAISITIQKQTARSVGWLDKLTVNARRALTVAGRQTQFRDTRVSGAGKICSYNLSTQNPAGLQLWNITDPVNPFIQAYNTQPGGAIFVAAADTLNEYCAAPAGDFYTPVPVGRVQNQNLHAIMQADFIIVAHPLFIKEAHRLGTFHQQQEGYSYCVATTEQIYNEFSSGRPDVSAIRDFIRMIYSRNENSGRQVRFVCLMGDGSYNNKSRNLVNNSNLIPTYQSLNSLSPSASVATDDFFAMMDPDEGVRAEHTGNVDLGIGRFTCRTVQEVQAVLNKIEHYYSKPSRFQIEETIPISESGSQSTMGDWRTWLLFVADDMDAALHMDQADSLARLVKDLAPGYNNDKILLDAYQRFSTPGGNRYPDAARDFLRRMEKGALLFNYTGHGGEVGLTAERLVDVEMINGLSNFDQMPLFVTATCEFSRYDDPARTSAGELSLLNPKGAAIALLTTCRLAFASVNFELNLVLLRQMFSKLPDGSYPALGDIIQKTKSSMPTQTNFANFHLLGDPALRLAYPEYNVRTTNINGTTAGGTTSDTLKALGKITVQGIVTDHGGKKMNAFNGLIYPTVFDKEQEVQGLLNDPTSAFGNNELPFVFNLQKNILYRGKAEVKNGDFTFSFIVPKDISFAPGRGKISYYASSGNTDAMGHYTNVVVGGAAENAATDEAGPVIDLFLNDKNFVSGGITHEAPILYADLIDSSGINTSGIGLGHDITVILDEGSDKPVILNDYYEANLNSYQSGRVRYPFTELMEGPHSLTFKAWDIQNNSSIVALDFVVARRAELALEQVLNYPNPFTTRTSFFFQHNQSGAPLQVHIQVYTVSGKLVKTIKRTVVSQGFLSEGLEWDGKDDFGDKLARGVYIYKLAILDIHNAKAEKIEKLVILN